MYTHTHISSAHTITKTHYYSTESMICSIFTIPRYLQIKCMDVLDSCLLSSGRERVFGDLLTGSNGQLEAALDYSWMDGIYARYM